MFDDLFKTVFSTDNDALLENITLIKPDVAPVASNDASIANSFNIPKYLCQSKQIWEFQSG